MGSVFKPLLIGCWSLASGTMAELSIQFKHYIPGTEKMLQQYNIIQCIIDDMSIIQYQVRGPRKIPGPWAEMKYVKLQFF